MRQLTPRAYGILKYGSLLNAYIIRNGSDLTLVDAIASQALRLQLSRLSRLLAQPGQTSRRFFSLMLILITWVIWLMFRKNERHHVGPSPGCSRNARPAACPQARSEHAALFLAHDNENHVGTDILARPCGS